MTKDFFEQKIKEATEELSKKSYRDIQVETAFKWAARACASYKNVSSAKTDGAKLHTYLLAEEYAHEAVEHAALVPTLPDDILKDVQRLIEPFQIEAYDELEVALNL
jgi:hypothetical protein